MCHTSLRIWIYPKPQFLQKRDIPLWIFYSDITWASCLNSPNIVQIHRLISMPIITRLAKSREAYLLVEIVMTPPYISDVQINYHITFATKHFSSVSKVLLKIPGCQLWKIIRCFFDRFCFLDTPRCAKLISKNLMLIQRSHLGNNNVTSMDDIKERDLPWVGGGCGWLTKFQHYAENAIYNPSIISLF